MNVSENIRTLRKQSHLSQEDLAERLGVSRQAVTKWETGAGVPDISNIVGLARLFGTSVDDLLGAQTASAAGAYLYESVTEFDADGPRGFDIDLGRARNVYVSGCSGEKVRLVLGSDAISTLTHDFKVKLDMEGKGYDIDLVSSGNIPENEVRDSLDVVLQLPDSLLCHVEVSAIANSVHLADIENGEIELSLKAPMLSLSRVKAPVEVDCNVDMDIQCATLEASLEINQLNATSCVTVPADVRFAARCRGIKTKLAYREGDERCDPFAEDEADVCIGLNGFNSELVICR